MQYLEDIHTVKQKNVQKGLKKKIITVIMKLKQQENVHHHILE